ncbi:MAG: hypothetical protein ACRDTD_28755 [Pseudonocardiaceae bacterium]
MSIDSGRDAGKAVGIGTPPGTDQEALSRYVELARSEYTSIVSYSVHGTIVPTQARIAPYAGHLVLTLPANSKALRYIAMGLPVRCAPCDPDGSLIVDPIEVAARIMTEEELPTVRVALAAKYGWWMRLGLAVGRLSRVFLPMRRTRRIGVELTVS